MAGSVRRRFGFVSFGLPFVLVATVSACGDDGSDASPTTIPPLQPTNYVTQPVFTVSTTTEPGASTPAGGTGAAQQQYRVRPGDAISLIANLYGITADDLASYNQWGSGTRHVLQPGDLVNIPPFADIPEGADTTDGGLDEMLIEGPICPDGTEQDTYEIESGDVIGRVAEDLEITVDELNEANARTAGYGAFYPGLEILVPCPIDDSETATGG